MNEDQVRNAVIVELGRMNYRVTYVNTLTEHGVDIIACNNACGRRFFIETKGDSPPSAKNQKSGREVRFTQVMGQILTRMQPTTGYYYGVAFPNSYRQLALRRIPWQVAKLLKLHVFLVHSRNEIDVLRWREMKTAKTTSKKAVAATKRVGKRSLADAAIRVMREIGKPTDVKTVVNAVLAKRLWSGDGKTPAATLSATILREIQTKGARARFQKTDRGMFELKTH